MTGKPVWGNKTGTPTTSTGTGALWERNFESVLTTGGVARKGSREEKKREIVTAGCVGANGKQKKALW